MRSNLIFDPTTPLSIRYNTVSVTASIGVACHPEHGNTLEDIKEKADKAMYASKTTGKNRVTVYSDSALPRAASEPPAKT